MDRLVDAGRRRERERIRTSNEMEAATAGTSNDHDAALVRVFREAIALARLTHVARKDRHDVLGHLHGRR